MAKSSITWIKLEIGGPSHHGRRIRLAKTAVSTHLIHSYPDSITVPLHTCHCLYIWQIPYLCVILMESLIRNTNMSLTTESCHVKHQLSSWASFIQWYPQHLTVIIHVSYASVQIKSINSQALAIPEAVYMEEYSDACWAHAYCWINSKIMLTSVWQW